MVSKILINNVYNKTGKLTLKKLDEERYNLIIKRTNENVIIAFSAKEIESLKKLLK